jgi:aldehyde:ferredoxin oxidoreductase
MFTGGYTLKLLRINLTEESYQAEDIPETYFRALLGGRGVAAKYYYDEIGPDIKPFSDGNKLIFMTGPLTGTPVYSGTKFQLATKSPLSERYICSNSSGFFGPELKCAGFDGIIVEGKASRPVYITIVDIYVEFHDAAPVMGKTTFQVEEYIKANHSDIGKGIMSIGVGGENRVAYACIQVGDRSFGRGGGGAVMGDKNLKAIAVHGTGKVKLHNEADLKEYITNNMKAVKDSKPTHTKLGTAQYTEVINNLGCYSVANFQTAVLENAESIYAGEFMGKYKIKNAACYRCPIACSQVCDVKEGPFKGAKSDPEYETIGAFGGQCCVLDPAAIIAANEVCDEVGIDTMQAGTMIAFAMELNQRGLLKSEEMDGLDFSWGNGETVVALLHKIANREGIGDLLANSMYEIAREHPDWAKYLMHVKGMAFAAYEPRGFYGMGLAYGTSARGACHNVGGWTIRDELTSGKFDRFALKGKGKMVKDIQDTRAYVDSLGVCTVVRSGMGFSDNPSGKVLEYVTGVDFIPELMEIGERVYGLERLIYEREGVTREDDYLPERTMTEALPSGMAKGSVLTKEMYDVMLDEYYALRYWDADGRPTSEGIERLGLVPLIQ